MDVGGWHSHAEGAPCGGAAAELVQHALARHRLTAPLPAADLATLAAAFTPVAVADAGCVFEEGEARDLALYVVERGAVERYEGGAPGGPRGHLPSSRTGRHHHRPRPRRGPDRGRRGQGTT